MRRNGTSAAGPLLYDAAAMALTSKSEESLSALGRAFRAGLRAIMPRRSITVGDPAGLRDFLQTRSSYVAQTSLYGYLRTRAGTRFPMLFENDDFVRSVNIAKWHVWLACLSDLSVFAGGLILRRGAARSEAVGAMLVASFDAILAATGTPPDAGAEFGAHAQRVRARLALCDWTAVTDDATPFSESEQALVYWAPIADELKRHDVQIVRNSIRFLWQEVRRDLRRVLDAAALLAGAGAPTSPASTAPGSPGSPA